MRAIKRASSGRTKLARTQTAPARKKLADAGRSCACNNMKSTCESQSPPGTRTGRAARGNCVAARRGGEQPEADLRSQTKVNLIRPTPVASLRSDGEASRANGHRTSRTFSSQGWIGRWRVVEVRTQGRSHGRSMETHPDRTPRKRSRAGVRAAIVASKRGNARGAKDGREAERQRP